MSRFTRSELIRRRKAAGLSLATLGERVGLSASAVRAIETGRTGSPSHDNVVKIAKVLGWSISVNPKAKQ